MKKFGFLAIIAAAAALPAFTGCATLTQTPGENYNMVKHTMRDDLLQVPDDVDDMLLLSKPSMLSEKPVPIR